MYKVGLVLEGGGMRGMFTAGVLDYFLEKELEFAGIIGVSAGCIHACSFIAKQKNRSREITLEFIHDKRYCSLKSLRQTGDLFNTQFVYHDIPKKYYPFDNETFNKSKSKFWVCATDIVKGKPKYFQVKTFANGEIDIIRASSSLPMISNIVKYQGKEYLDGGATDSIPIKKMESMGYEKNVVILTRVKGYRKRPSRSYLAMKKRYKKYPNFINAIKNRHINYNETMDYLEKQRDAGKLFMIEPERKLKVRRIEKNKSRLEESYNEGYQTAKRVYDDLMKFLSE